MVEGGKPNDPLRTALAAKGVEMSALFFVVFEDFEFPGTPRRRPRLVAPPGPSTGGGKMSRQHISLSPVAEGAGPAVVVGWANPSTRRAELRSFKMVAAAFRQRFKRELDIPPGVYRKFIRKAEEFFREQGFTIVEIEQSLPQSSASPQRSWVLWSLILMTTLLLGVGLGIVWMLWERGAL